MTFGTRSRHIATGLLLCLVPTLASLTSAAAARPCNNKHVCSTDTPPTASIWDPGTGATVSGMTIVDGTASDDVAVAQVEVRVDRRAFMPATGIAPWTVPLDTAAYANGNHTLTARATDTSGNSFTVSVKVNVQNAAAADTSPPTVSIGAPTPGATVAGTIQLSGSSGDDVGVTAIRVGVDGGTPLVASGTASWTVGVDTTTFADGSHVITATALDAAGNTTVATTTLAFLNNPSPLPSPSPSPTPAPSATHMVTPEGVTIDVNSAGSWTAQQIYDLLKPSALQLSAIGPHLTINVQDTYASQTVTSAGTSGGTYTSFQATVYLKGVDSTFAIQPDAQIAHEYGHVWTLYHLYIDHQGDWTDYLAARWTTADGSVRLSGDGRLDTNYNWNRSEIIADDYRLLFGSALAVSERTAHLNSEIPQPKDVTGLKNFLLNTWGA
jgi:hypothetical protein